MGNQSQFAGYHHSSLLAEYFKVSTDQLLGLKPLDGETYIPEKTATKDFGTKSWNTF